MIERVVRVLEENPKRIAEITVDLTPERLRTSAGDGAWSANEVLAHLRCCADVWGAGLKTILEEDQPTIRAVSPRGWIKRTNYLELDFESSFRAFRTQRDALLVLLRSLPVESWERAATIKASGKATSWTLLAYAERLANHEHHHLTQFERCCRVESRE